MANLKIYLTNLGKYNEGELVGEWVDLPVDDDELQEVFKRIGIGATDEFGQPYEEYFITDYESEIPGLIVDEYDSLDKLNALAETIDAFDEWDLKLFRNASEAGLIDDIEDFDPDRFRLYDGVYDDQALGETIIDEMYGDLSELPQDVLEDNFDYEGFGRDFRLEWDPYSWLEDYSEEELESQYGTTDVGNVSAYDYFGVSSDYALGETIVNETYGDISELGKDTLETYFDYASYASDIARFCGAYTEDGFIEDTEA